MARSTGVTIMLAAMLLAGCGSGGKPVGGLSAEDAAQLDNDAEVLDASPDGLAAPEGLQPANDAESTSGNRATTTPAGS